jgi:hypothetical protein
MSPPPPTGRRRSRPPAPIIPGDFAVSTQGTSTGAFHGGFRGGLDEATAWAIFFEEIHRTHVTIQLLRAGRVLAWLGPRPANHREEPS